MSLRFCGPFYFLIHFRALFPAKMKLHSVHERIINISRDKGKIKVIKRSKMPLLGFLVLLTGLWDLKDILISRQNRSSKNILVSENAVKRVHGSCLLRVMDS